MASMVPYDRYTRALRNWPFDALDSFFDAPFVAAGLDLGAIRKKSGRNAERGGLVVTVREAGRDESRREKAEVTVNPVSRDVAARQPSCSRRRARWIRARHPV